MFYTQVLPAVLVQIFALFMVVALFATVATPTPTKAKCQYCGKAISKASALLAGHGKRCKAMQAKFSTPKVVQAHRAKRTLTGIPPGYIKTASLHKHITAQRAAGKTLCTPAAMVRAFGTDKGAYPPTHPIAQFYYIAGSRARYINAWCATAAGLAAMASGNFAKAPTPPTQVQLAAVVGGGKPQYKVHQPKLLGQ